MPSTSSHHIYEPIALPIALNNFGEFVRDDGDYATWGDDSVEQEPLEIENGLPIAEAQYLDDDDKSITIADIIFNEPIEDTCQDMDAKSVSIICILEDTRDQSLKIESPHGESDKIDDAFSASLFSFWASDQGEILAFESDDAVVPLNVDTSENRTNEKSSDNSTEPAEMEVDREPSGGVGTITVTPNDVLIGHSPIFRRHTGNERLKELVSSNASEYLHERTKKHRKTEIAKMIVNIISQDGGRFLRAREQKSGLSITEIEWEEIQSPTKKKANVASKFRNIVRRKARNRKRSRNAVSKSW